MEANGRTAEISSNIFVPLSAGTRTSGHLELFYPYLISLSLGIGQNLCRAYESGEAKARLDWSRALVLHVKALGCVASEKKEQDLYPSPKEKHRRAKHSTRSIYHLPMTIFSPTRSRRNERTSAVERMALPNTHLDYTGSRREPGETGGKIQSWMCVARYGQHLLEPPQPSRTTLLLVRNSASA